jgi:hypothetical protein
MEEKRQRTSAISGEREEEEEREDIEGEGRCVGIIVGREMEGKHTTAIVKIDFDRIFFKEICTQNGL